jgi:hypothetical protein
MMAKMSKVQTKTIAISKKNHQALIQRGRKNQSFDQILSEILQRSGVDAKETVERK